MNNKGQNLVEFGMILGAIVIVCIIALTFFGDNVKALFTGSSSEYNKQTAFKWKEGTANPLNQSKGYVSNTPGGYNPNVVVDKPVTTTTTTATTTPTTNSPVTSTTTISNTEVSMREDGSMSFIVDGQSVVLSPEIKSLCESAFETVGAPAVTEVIAEIKYLIEKNKDTYPDGVPLQIAFGDMIRSNEDGIVMGTSEINTVSIKVNNNLVMLTNDIECTGTCSYTGKYRIEGSYNNDIFNGNISSLDKSLSGNFTGNIMTTGGLIISAAEVPLTDQTNNVVQNSILNVEFADDKSYDL